MARWYQTLVLTLIPMTRTQEALTRLELRGAEVVQVRSKRKAARSMAGRHVVILGRWRPSMRALSRAESVSWERTLGELETWSVRDQGRRDREARYSLMSGEIVATIRSLTRVLPIAHSDCITSDWHATIHLDADDYLSQAFAAAKEMVRALEDHGLGRVCDAITLDVAQRTVTYEMTAGLLTGAGSEG